MIRNYKSFEDKKSLGNLDREIVTNYNELYGKLSRYTSYGYCFRGQRDYHWSVVSSAQRMWNNWRCKDCIDGPLSYHDYLFMSLEYAKKQNLFPRCVNCCSRDGLRDHERWGYLQHFGWPSPFVDFSSDFRVALYMAVCHLSVNCGGGCFSVFVMDPHYSLCENEIVDLDAFADQNGGGSDCFEFDTWYKMTLIMRKDSRTWCPEISRGRMASQSGLFVYLPTAEKSLDDLFGESEAFERGKIDECGPYRKKLLRIDVPYELVNDIKAYLMNEKITSAELGLSDTTIDDKNKHEYRKFEDWFISMDLKLKKEISLPPSTFCRSSGEDSLFWSGRSGAQAMVEDMPNLGNEVSGKRKSFYEVIHGMYGMKWSRFGASAGDCVDVIEQLGDLGLVKISECEGVCI